MLRASAAGRPPRTPAPPAAPARRRTCAATSCSPIGSPSQVNPQGTADRRLLGQVERIAEARPVAPALRALGVRVLDAGCEGRQRRARRDEEIVLRQEALHRDAQIAALQHGVLDLGPTVAGTLLGHRDEAGIEPRALLGRQLLQQPRRRREPGAGEDAAGPADRRVDQLDPRAQIGQHRQRRVERRPPPPGGPRRSPASALAAIRRPARPPSSPIR